MSRRYLTPELSGDDATTYWKSGELNVFVKQPDRTLKGRLTKAYGHDIIDRVLGKCQSGIRGRIAGNTPFGGPSPPPTEDNHEKGV